MKGTERTNASAPDPLSINQPTNQSISFIETKIDLRSLLTQPQAGPYNGTALSGLYFLNLRICWRVCEFYRAFERKNWHIEKTINLVFDP